MAIFRRGPKAVQGFSFGGIALSTPPFPTPPLPLLFFSLPVPGSPSGKTAQFELPQKPMKLDKTD